MLGASIVFALLLVGVRSLLSSDPVLNVLLKGLPQLAVLVPVLWIVQQEKLTRAARETSAPAVRSH